MKRKLYLFGVLLPLLFFLVPCHAFNLGGGGSSRYSYSRFEGKEGSSSFWSLNNRFYLNYSSSVTPLIRSAAGVSYSRIDQRGGVYRSIFHPYLSFVVDNYLFRSSFSFDYSNRQRSDTPQVESYYWNLRSSSNWQWKVVPEATFQYSGTRQFDSGSPRSIDSASHSFMVGLAKNMKDMGIRYSYRHNFSFDYLHHSEQESMDHSANLNLRRSFWHGKASLGGTANYGYHTSISRVKTGGTVREVYRAEEGYYGVDDTPEESSLNHDGRLIDGDYTTVVVTTQDDMNIGLGLALLQEVDTLYVYTESGYVYDPHNPNETVTWAIYWSNDPGEPKDWVLLTSSASFVFNELEHRFELSFPSQRAQHFKVVFYPGPAAVFFGITEIEAAGTREAEHEEESSSSTQNYGGSLNLSFRLHEDWSTSFHASYRRTESSTGPYSYSYSLGGHVGWTPSRYFLMGLSASSSTSYSSGAETARSDSVSFSWRSNPLETLSTSLTASYGRSFRGSKETSRTGSASFNAVAIIWEGVDLNGRLNFSRSEKLEQGGVVYSYGSGISCGLALFPRLHWTWSMNYEHSEGTWSYSASSTTTYNPSSRLYGRITLRYDTSSEGGYSFSHDYSVGCFIGRKIQLNLSARFEEGGERCMSSSVNLYWRIGRRASFRCGYSYASSDVGENHAFQSSFNITF